MNFQFVTNVLFGKFMLGKSITRRMQLGTFATVAGTTLAILFCSTEVRVPFAACQSSVSEAK